MIENKNKKWRCKICGYIHEGSEPPAICQRCGASRNYFEKVEEKQIIKNMTFHKNIITLAKENENFRQVVNTGKYSQLVLMNLLPGEEIGEEVHDAVDQILVFVEGNGETVIEGQSSPIKEGDLIFVNAGVKHNFINTGNDSLKLYTVYSPANHPADRVQKTKAEAMEEEY